MRVLTLNCRWSTYLHQDQWSKLVAITGDYETLVVVAEPHHQQVLLISPTSFSASPLLLC